MIFSPDLAAKVLDGSKTQTRRRDKVDGPFRYKTGRDYAVQERRGGKALGRILVNAVWREYVQDISEEDARAEGFASRNGFLNRWHNMYGGLANHEVVWCIEFKLCGSAHVDGSSVDCATSPKPDGRRPGGGINR